MSIEQWGQEMRFLFLVIQNLYSKYFAQEKVTILLFSPYSEQAFNVEKLYKKGFRCTYLFLIGIVLLLFKVTRL